MVHENFERIVVLLLVDVIVDDKIKVFDSFAKGNELSHPSVIEDHLVCHLDDWTLEPCALWDHLFKSIERRRIGFFQDQKKIRRREKRRRRRRRRRLWRR